MQYDQDRQSKWYAYHYNHLKGRRHLTWSWLHSGSKCCSSFCPWLVCHVMNSFCRHSLKLSRFIKLLDRYVRFWTRYWSTMGSYVILCGEYNIARDILSWSVSFFFHPTHCSSRLAGMIYKMDPFLMPRPFCIGLWCNNEVLNPWLMFYM